MTTYKNNKPPERRAKMTDKVKTIIKGVDENNSAIKVTAYYPQLNQPYRWDKALKRSVPCSTESSGAGYSTNFTMDETTAKSLFAVMKEAYSNDPKNRGSWGSLKMPFTKDDDGNFRYAARTGAMFQTKSGENVKRLVKQRDANGQLLPENFELTSDSRISLQVTCNPGETHSSKVEALGEHTVTLWIDQVLVHDLAPRKEYNPFGETSGSFDSSATNTSAGVKEDNPFEKPVEEPVEEADPFEEGPVEEPKKAVKKTAPPPSAATEDDLSSIVEDWDD